MHGTEESNDLLLKAVNNEKNNKFINLTFSKINKIKQNALKTLHIHSTNQAIFEDKLKNYIYIDEICDIRIGTYIRWIPLNSSGTIYITSGSIICDLNIVENNVIILCKNFKHRYYEINMKHNMIFQKLTPQESILLTALSSL